VSWGGIRRAFVAAAAGIALALVGAAPAMAEGEAIGVTVSKPRYGEVTMKHKGDSIRATVSPLTLKIGANEVLAYCIDIRTGTNGGLTYEEGDWAESGSVLKANLGKVQWVLLHSYPQLKAADVAKTAGLDTTGRSDADVNELVYTATQAAVWHFSDGAEFVKVKDSDFPAGAQAFVQSLYTWLTDEKRVTTAPEPQPALSVTPKEAVAEVGKLAGPFKVGGPNAEITITVTGGKAVDKDGKPLTKVVNGTEFYLSRDGVGPVGVRLDTKVDVSSGRVFLFKDGKDKKQKLILAGSTGVPDSASAAARFQPQPESSTSPSPSVSPSAPAGGSGGGGNLPVTGASTTIAVGAGLLLLVAGAVAVLLVRRRKVRFTA
jgi:TQXA domain-containing protein/LPXTG-motif cell wall-anchored protein